MCVRVCLRARACVCVQERLFFKPTLRVVGILKMLIGVGVVVVVVIFFFDKRNLVSFFSFVRK